MLITLKVVFLFYCSLFRSPRIKDTLEAEDKIRPYCTAQNELFCYPLMSPRNGNLNQLLQPPTHAPAVLALHTARPTQIGNVIC